MMTNLNHAPPIRSAWKLGEERSFRADCMARHEANKVAWLAIHAEAGLSFRERLARRLRGIIKGKRNG